MGVMGSKKSGNGKMKRTRQNGVINNTEEQLLGRVAPRICLIDQMPDKQLLRKNDINHLFKKCSDEYIAQNEENGEMTILPYFPLEGEEEIGGMPPHPDSELGGENPELEIISPEEELALYPAELNEGFGQVSLYFDLNILVIIVVSMIILYVLNSKNIIKLY